MDYLDRERTAGGLTAGTQTPEGARPTGFTVALLSAEGRMQSCWVPLPAKGKYYFEDEHGSRSDLYLVEQNGSWEARSTGGSVFMDTTGTPWSSLRLADQCLVQVKQRGGSKALFAELTFEESGKFHNYRPMGTAEITIGKLPENDIVCRGKLVSRRHARLLYSRGQWMVQDTNSLNGVYVNGIRIREKALQLGDEIYILGLRILIGCGFISINDGSDRIHVNRGKLERLLSTAPMTGVSTGLPQTDSTGKLALFNRLPRRRTAADFKDIELEGPPMSLNGDQIPLLLRMGSPMAMGVSSLMYGNVMSLLSTLLFPLMTQKYTEKQKQEYEQRRRTAYGEYLRKKKEEILREKDLEEQTLRANYPDLNDVLHYIDDKKKLWERRYTDDDFLLMRLGFGKQPMTAQISAPTQRFQMDEDPLEQKMYALAGTQIRLEDVPITVDLKKDRVIGVTGGRAATALFIRQLLIRMSILYSYDEVKLVFLAEESDLREFEFVRFLPHIWDDQRSIRFIASNDSEAYQIGEYLKAAVDKDLQDPRELNKILHTRPYYVVVALSKRVFDGIEAMKDIMAQEKNIGISVLSVYENVPKECTLLLHIGSDGNCTMNDLRKPDEGELPFRRDYCDEQLASACMRTLSNTRLKLVSQSYALPKALTFLEMFGVGRVEHLNPAARWKNSNPIKTLAAPVGVASDGSVFMLDLHQKFQGPHGLVAGTTGSGKSEFLITYILSMALNYHPDEVAFVLIDYKGGGLVGAFDDPARGIHLPHLIGTITNLDGAAIQRSLVSLESELKRRQRVFNEAKSISGEGTMDIYTYQRLVRSGVVKEPVPHLIIISDEFAELKAQQPEFMDQLISTARIGRSLGVHLILATQKPSGVVNEQIRSNTKFQVCLKVQDKSDSVDMIGRPDAAELKETGRFYLQVGYNEFFALGQSGWSGADYEPQEEVVVNRDDSIQVIDLVGQNVLEVKPKKKKGISQGSQLVAIVRYLSELAKEQGIEQRSLWQEPLAEHLDADALQQEAVSGGQALRDENAAGITTVIGMFDDPANQRQFPYTLDLIRNGHTLVVGDQGSGKSVFLQTLVLSLAEKYSPQQVQFYMLDYSGRMLRIFEKLPHCGAVLDEEQEDSLKPFFEMLDDLVAERKKLFAELEVDSFEAAARHSDLPLILVLIDNISGLMNAKQGYDFYNNLAVYLKKSAAYGIRYILTMSHLNEISSRIRQEIPYRIALHLKDRYEYADILECRCNYTPPERSGRGMAVFEETPLEFHAAMYLPEAEEKARVGELKERIRRRSEACTSERRARRLAVVSETETYAEFAAGFAADRIPLGYSLKDARPVALPLRQFTALSLYFGNPSGIVPVLENLLTAARRENMKTVVLSKTDESAFDPAYKASLDPDFLQETQIYKADEAGISALAQVFTGEIMQRNTVLDAYCRENGISAQSPDLRERTFSFMRNNTQPLLVLLEGYADLCRVLQDKGEEDNELINRYAAYFALASRYQIYLIACTFPGDDRKLSGCELVKYFNTEKTAILFGGRLDSQPLLSLPMEYRGDKAGAPNRCLMYYREGYYPMLMPCGELKKENVPADSLSIFGQE